MNVQIFFTLLFLSAVVGLVVFKSLHEWIYCFPSRTESQVIPYLRSVDLENLKDLLNLAQEGYLRLNLSATEFRTEQRQRIALTLEYYGRMAHNTQLLGEWANTEFRKSWQTGNRDVTAISRGVLDTCIEFRLHAWYTRMKLHAWLFRIRVLPFIPIPLLAEARRIGSFDLVYSYEQIKLGAEKLSHACGSDYCEQLSQGM
jgi:hypothetical protein